MKKLLTFLRSAAVAFAILIAGQGAWGIVLQTNLRSTPAIPWFFPLMCVYLWAMWRFFTANPSRRNAVRALPVGRNVMAWTIAAGVFGAAAFAGLWIALFQLVPTPPNVIPTGGAPFVVTLLMTAMGSMVAPITEELAFRGYCQSALEREFPPVVAITLSSALFMCAHLNYGLYWPKMLVYFLFGVFMGSIAYLTGSIVPGIPAHAIADFTFFTMVWPNDGSRSGEWFWLHVAQFAVFGVLTILSLQRAPSRSRLANPAFAQPVGGAN